MFWRRNTISSGMFSALFLCMLLINCLLLFTMKSWHEQLGKRRPSQHKSKCEETDVPKEDLEIQCDIGYAADIMNECETKPKALHGSIVVSLQQAEITYYKLSNIKLEQTFKDGTNSLGTPMATGDNISMATRTFYPLHCRPAQSVAIIIPFRDREEHLRRLLGHLVPVLQRQLIRYSIFVVSQHGNGVFNKGRLMNTGFEYAVKAGNISGNPFDCFVFHDVDLLVEHDTLLYRCSKGNHVDHFSTSIDKFKYKYLCCGMTVGGVLAFSEEQFRKVNGYPNVYWGWGGEDDDMDGRIAKQHLAITRQSSRNGRYTMMKHERDINNAWSEQVDIKVDKAEERYESDGLSNLNTTIIKIERFTLFINIVVDVEVDSTSHSS